MAKKDVSTNDIASRLLSTGFALGSASTQKSEHPRPRVEKNELKRLNLDINIEQWRKLKHHAISNDMSMSDVVRGFIDAL